MVKARNCFTSPETLIDHALSIPILLQFIEKQFDKAGHSTVQGPTQGGQSGVQTSAEGRACGRNDAYGKCRGIEFMVGLQNEGATDKIRAEAVCLPGIGKKQVNWLLVRLT